MYLLPSTSTSVAPAARLMNSGDPPTDLNARTGLSTPPGSSCVARAKSFFDLSVRIGKRQRYQRRLPYALCLTLLDRRQTCGQCGLTGGRSRSAVRMAESAGADSGHLPGL